MLNRLKAAIDIGNHSTKIIEYKPIKNGIVINDIYRLEGLESENLISDILNSLKAKQVTLMFSSSNSSFLKLEEKNPNKYLKSKVKSLAKDGYNADFIKLNDDSFLFSYIQRDLVEKTVRPLIKKKDVKAIDTNSSAMIYFSKLYTGYETEIFLDIGHLSSEVLIKHKGEIIKYDKLNIGIFQIIEDIKESIGASYSETMELVIRIGLDKNNLPINTNEMLEGLHITEFEYGSSVHDRMEYFLARMVDLLRSEHPFEADKSRLILVGGGPLIRGMENIIKESLKIKIETFSLVSSTSGDFKIVNDTDQKIDSAYAPAIGLALREVLK